MTCIVAVKNPETNTVILGADSASSSRYNTYTSVDKKLFKLKIQSHADSNIEIGFAFTSSWRMGQILRHHLELPRYTGKDPMNYLVEDLIPEIRDKLKSHGYTSVHDNEETGGFFLVGFLGRIFNIQSDFHVGEYTYSFFADGCGKEFALGAMFTLDENEIEQESHMIALRGLQAANMFSGSVCEPFEFMEV